MCNCKTMRVCRTCQARAIEEIPVFRALRCPQCLAPFQNVRPRPLQQSLVIHRLVFRGGCSQYGCVMCLCIIVYMYLLVFHPMYIFMLVCFVALSQACDCGSLLAWILRRCGLQCVSSAIDCVLQWDGRNALHDGVLI